MTRSYPALRMCPLSGGAATGSVRATMAAAAGGAVGRAIGTKLAVHGQELIRKFRAATA
jgi:hypothetical protein